jgi:hypothetical protein
MKMSCEVAKKRMRRKATQLVRQTVDAGRRVYTLVNTAGGMAPITAEGLERMLRN